MLDPLGRERTGQVSHLVGRGGCRLPRRTRKFAYRSSPHAALDNPLWIFDQYGRSDAADREFSQPGVGIELKALPHRARVLRIPV